MSSIRFSVIIPAYNAAATIEAAVHSCLSQTLLPVEIIVVDDGSIDDTVAIVRAIDSDLIQLIVLDKNSGPSVARNRGMGVATGDYYAFLDADDIWFKNKLFILDGVLRDRPEIEFLAHSFKLESAEANKKDREIPLQKISVLSLLVRNTITPSCVIIRNTIKVRFNEAMRYTEDYELWLRMIGRTGIYWTDMPLTIKPRLSLAPGGQSGRKWQMRKGEMRAYTNFVLRNPVWIPGLPFLIAWSLLKQLRKMLTD